MTAMPNSTPSDPDIDTVLRLFADQTCRNTIAYLTSRAHSDTISVDDLAADLTTYYETAQSAADLRTVLHHSVLPRLDDIGMLDYDTWAKTVHLRGEPELVTHVRERLESDTTPNGSSNTV